MTADRDALLARQRELRAAYVLPPERRPGTTARGLHHAALIFEGKPLLDAP